MGYYAMRKKYWGRLDQMSPYELDDDEIHTVYTQEVYVCKRCSLNDPWHVCEGRPDNE